MTAVGATLRGRAAAESLMVDECAVSRPGEPFTDPESGVVSPSSVPVYSGACKVQAAGAQSANPVAGGHLFSTLDSRVDFPVEAGPFQVDDVVTITASLLDPLQVGRVFRVTEVLRKSFATAQRCRVEEVTA